MSGNVCLSCGVLLNVSTHICPALTYNTWPAPPIHNATGGNIGAPSTARSEFHGHEGRECGEHRTTGQRAWCHDCSEWCYPELPCKGCELPQLRAEVQRLNEQIGTVWREMNDAVNEEHDSTSPRSKAATTRSSSRPATWSS